MSSKDLIVNIPPSHVYDEKQSQDVKVSTAEVSAPRPTLDRSWSSSDSNEDTGPAFDGDLDAGAKSIQQKRVKFGVVRAWCLYILPLAIPLAIPIILFATVFKSPNIEGTRLLGLFVWIEIVWIGLWVAKLMSIVLPVLSHAFLGLLNADFRQYSYMLHALQIPIYLFIWTIFCFGFRNWITHWQLPGHKFGGPEGVDPNWFHIFTKVLRANVATAAIFLVEKTLVQLIGISFNRGKLRAKIDEHKKFSRVLELLYDASVRKHPAHTAQYLLDLDISIQQNTDIECPHTRRILWKMTTLGDAIASIFGDLASEITGQEVFRPTATHSLVNSALDRRLGAEALGARLWRTTVPRADAEAFTEEDVLAELGEHREHDARWILSILDRDRNGDVSLDEMKMFTIGVHNERKNMYRSYQNVKEALKVLDNVLSIVVLIIVALIYGTSPTLSCCQTC